ncbi:hypothetical protein V8C44DRAFT_336789 [Trichoderma aethiopicum]
MYHLQDTDKTFTMLSLSTSFRHRTKSAEINRLDLLSFRQSHILGEIARRENRGPPSMYCYTNYCHTAPRVSNC